MTASPLELGPRCLYRFVIDNVREASRCTQAGDIEGSRVGGESGNGRNSGVNDQSESPAGWRTQRASSAELYGYMASRLLQGHLEQVSEPFDEVERLMPTLLDSWENVDNQDDTHSFAAAAYGNGSEVYTPVNVSY